MKRSLNKIQILLLDILSYLHDFCIKNNIKYYVIGGTMLGAVRHKGFIPWDDDIDIGMPRKDYDKFISLYKCTDNDRYILETSSTVDEYFPYAFSKLYDRKTTLIENTNNKIVRGIYIDIFPLDGIGNNEKEVRKNYRKILFYKNILTLRYMNNDKDRGFFKKSLISFVHHLPSKYFSEKALRLKLDTLCRKFDYDECKYIGNLLGAYNEKEIMSKDIIGKPTLYEFENMKVYGPEKYDEYLTSLYGNYMELPPVEKRVSHHDHYLDLNTPYDKYDSL